MHPSIAAIAGIFRFDDKMFNEKIVTLDTETLTTRVAGKANPLLWMAGHLTHSRAYLLKILGTQKEFSWTPLFNENYDETKKYPAIGEIASAWQEISNELFDKLEQAGEAELMKRIEGRWPHGDNTVLGAAVFFAYHEGWHLGQASLVRKCEDMAGLVEY